jgi:prolyl oligopeptidase
MQPNNKRDETIIDNYHGTKVSDPYRWLENSNSDETTEWTVQQNNYTRAFLDASNRSENIRQRLTGLYNYPRYGIPSHKYDSGYFFAYNSGLQNQSVLYRCTDFKSERALVIDPNRLSDDGTVALISQSYNKDGSLLAYGTSQSGSDWQEIHVRDVTTGNDLPDSIKWTRFTNISWHHDGSGFFYNRLPDPANVPPERQSYNAKVYFHVLDTSQEEDKLIYERPDFPELNFSPEVTEDGNYLTLGVWNGTDPNNRFYYRGINEASWNRLLDGTDAAYYFIGNLGTTFYFHTTNSASKGRIIAIDLLNPEPDKWIEIVPEGEDGLDFVVLVHHQLILVALHNACHIMHRYALDGTHLGEISFPTLGAVNGLSGTIEGDEMFVGFTSFLIPNTVYRYDFELDSLSPLFSPSITFPFNKYETKQVFYPSKDGTIIPMFLTHRKGLKLDGQNPTLLYGYGGFNVNMTPNFGPLRLEWLEQGGIYAVANLRGGNEYGEAWHQAGILENKQNIFDDFISAAEWLIDSKYTSTPKLAIWGGSNGGLLVAACEIQRPDLYGAVICSVPVTDMLRYHRFTVGRYWIGEYGDAENNADQFRFMYAYSPLHNIREHTKYPPTLILTADTDDRVSPGHARKFAATLQSANNSTNPILIRIETKAGHGMGKPINKIIDEQTDIYTFLYQVLGM